MSGPITIGHSPDTDDIFMIYGLATGQIDTKDITFNFIARDIETLNTWAREGRLEVTAMSAHAFAYTRNRYKILSSGASMGENYLRPAEAEHSLQPGSSPGGASVRSRE